MEEEVRWYLWGWSRHLAICRAIRAKLSSSSPTFDKPWLFINCSVLNRGPSVSDVKFAKKKKWSILYPFLQWLGLQVGPHIHAVFKWVLWPNLNPKLELQAFNPWASPSHLPRIVYRGSGDQTKEFMPAGQHFTNCDIIPTLGEANLKMNEWIKNTIMENKCWNIKIDLTDSSDFVMWKFEVLYTRASIHTMNRRQKVIIKKKDTEIFQIFTIDSLNVVFLKQRKSKYNNFISIFYQYNT